MNIRLQTTPVDSLPTATSEADNSASLDLKSIVILDSQKFSTNNKISYERLPEVTPLKLGGEEFYVKSFNSDATVSLMDVKHFPRIEKACEVKNYEVVAIHDGRPTLLKNVRIENDTELLGEISTEKGIDETLLWPLTNTTSEVIFAKCKQSGVVFTFDGASEENGSFRLISASAENKIYSQLDLKDGLTPFQVDAFVTIDGGEHIWKVSYDPSLNSFEGVREDDDGAKIREKLSADQVIPHTSTIIHGDYGEMMVPGHYVAKSLLATAPRRVGKGWVMQDPDVNQSMYTPTVVPDGSVKKALVGPIEGFGRQLLEEFKTMAPGPVVIKMYKIHEDKNGSSLAKDFAKAIEEHTKKVSLDGSAGIVTIIENPILPLPKAIRDLGEVNPKVEIIQPITARVGVPAPVVHQKVMVGKNKAVFFTGDMTDVKGKPKDETMIVLENDFINLTVLTLEQHVACNPDGGDRRFRGYLVDNARDYGYLVNDPHADKFEVQRGINELIGKTKKTLLVETKCINNPQLTEKLLEAAERGIKVAVITQGFDSISMDLIKNSNSGDNFKIVDVDKKVRYGHHNIFLSDDKELSNDKNAQPTALVCTAYMINQQCILPDGTAFENAIVMKGTDYDTFVNALKVGDKNFSDYMSLQ